MKLRTYILIPVLLCAAACDDAKKDEAGSGDKKEHMSMQEMEAVIAEAEAKQAATQQADLKSVSDPVFAKHEAAGDACMEAAMRDLRESIAKAKAGEEVESRDSNPECDAFWAAVHADLPGHTKESLGIPYQNWRDAHGKPRPSLDG